MSFLTLRVRRVASSNGFRPTREFPTPERGVGLGRGHCRAARWNDSKAIRRSWKGNAIGLAVLREPHEEEGNYDYLCATAPLGTSLEPRRLPPVARARTLRPPLDTGVPPLPSPRRVREFEAYHRQIEVRSEDERWGPLLARSRVVTWFQRERPCRPGFRDTDSTCGRRRISWRVGTRCGGLLGCADRGS